MRIGIIRNKKTYRSALARIDALMGKDPASGTPGAEELDLLALLVADYESRTVPPVAVDPVEAIRFRMEQMGLSRRELVPFIGSLPKVSEVLSRKRPLSLSMIRRLHAGLDIPAEVLIGQGGDAGCVCAEPQAPYRRSAR